MDSHLKKPSTNSVGNWTPHEDEIILRYVYEKGKSDEHMMWGNLSETLNGRSGKSCRERWFNHLDPKIKRTEWSQEEQWVLFILRNQSSEKWSLISKKLMGRTDNAVKNYWNSRLKKRIDSMQHAVNQHFERKRKQKIAQMTQSHHPDQQAVSDQLQGVNGQGKQGVAASASGDQSSLLTKEQKQELDAYMDRIRAEYLQKILEQVNHQNVEYFENLACEYSVQYQHLVATSALQDQKQSPDQDVVQPVEDHQMALEARQPSQLPHEAVEDEVQYSSQMVPGIDTYSSQVCQRTPSPGKPEKILPPTDFDADDGNRSGDDDHSTLPAFMKKPEVIKMHLDILYKSIGFLSEEKIAAKIDQYKQAKEQKRKEEEERLQMQIQIKKQRGRSNNPQPGPAGPVHRKDRKMAEDEHTYGAGACAGTDDGKVEFGPGQSFQGKALARLQGCPTNGNNLTAKDTGALAGRFEQANVNYLNSNQIDKSQIRAVHGGALGHTTADQGMDLKAARDGSGAPILGGAAEAMKAGRPLASGYTSGFHPCSHIIQKTQCQQFGPNQSKLQKDGQIIPHKVKSRIQNQYQNRNCPVAATELFGNDDSSYCSSSSHSFSSRASGGSRRAAGGAVGVMGARAGMQEGHKLSPKSLGVRRMLKKLRKQKRQSKLIDKIFFSQKAERATGVADPYLVKPADAQHKRTASESVSQERCPMESSCISQAARNANPGADADASVNLQNQNWRSDNQRMGAKDASRSSSKKVQFEGNGGNDSRSQSPKINQRLRSAKVQLKDEVSPSGNQSKATLNLLPAKKLIQKPLKGRLSQAGAQRAAAAGQRPTKANKAHAQSAAAQEYQGYDYPEQEGATEGIPQAPIGYHSFGTAPTGLGQPNMPPQMYNYGYQVPVDVMGDPYGGVVNGNAGANAAPAGSSVFVNGGPQYHPQYHGGYLPFGLAGQPNTMHGHANAGPTPMGGTTYQTGGGTFFHHGCNIQYTDVKTFTTTIHLHCGGTSDGKSQHQGFCPEAAQSQATNPHHCQQTLHYTQTVPGQQHHHNLFNGGTQSFSSAPMAVVYTSAPAPEGHPGAFYHQHSCEQPCAQAHDTQNDFVIDDEHQITQEGAQSRGNMNNQSGSYQSSSKANATGRTSHSKRAAARNASLSGRRGPGGRSASNKNNFRTKNFLNQTMTQINKGKDRELNPLYNKRNAAFSSVSNGQHKLHQGPPGTAYYPSPHRAPAPFTLRPFEAGPVPQQAAPSTAQVQVDPAIMASPEVVKRRKETEGAGQNTTSGSQFQSEKMTQQSTPMTNKNIHMFQSPAPSQSFARVHTLYGSTPAPATYMSAEQHQKDQLMGVRGPPGHPHAHTAFKPIPQEALSAHFGAPPMGTPQHAGPKKNTRGLAPLTVPTPYPKLDGPAGTSSQVATPVFNPGKTLTMQNICNDKYMAQQLEAGNFSACLGSPRRQQQRTGGQLQDAGAFAHAQDNSHGNQNDYSSDILMKMKGKATTGRERAASGVGAEVAGEGFAGYRQAVKAQPQVHVPSVSAFKM